jgi:hypothetical protein
VQNVRAECLALRSSFIVSKKVLVKSPRRVSPLGLVSGLVAAVAWGPSVDCSRLTVFAFAAKAFAVFLGHPLGKGLSASPAALFGLECSPVDFGLHFIVSG